jgi:flagellar hook-basal body complex protein FliE
MTIEPLPSLAPATSLGSDDAPLAASPSAAPSPLAQSFGRALDAASASLGRADVAERAFASGTGGLQEMVLERAYADVALSLATAAASRATQSLSTILGMQV